MRRIEHAEEAAGRLCPPALAPVLQCRQVGGRKGVPRSLVPHPHELVRLLRGAQGKDRMGGAGVMHSSCSALPPLSQTPRACLKAWPHARRRRSAFPSLRSLDGLLLGNLSLLQKTFDLQ